MRKLWDHTQDPDVEKACKGISFGPKKDSFADSMISDIIDKRSGDKKLQSAVDKKKYGDYIVSLLRYCVPWLVLFLLALILGCVLI